jgi:hypothetical protein
LDISRGGEAMGCETILGTRLVLIRVVVIGLTREQKAM